MRGQAGRQEEQLLDSRSGLRDRTEHGTRNWTAGTAHPPLTVTHEPLGAGSGSVNVATMATAGFLLSARALQWHRQQNGSKMRECDAGAGAQTWPLSLPCQQLYLALSPGPSAYLQIMRQVKNLHKKPQLPLPKRRLQRTTSRHSGYAFSHQHGFGALITSGQSIRPKRTFLTTGSYSPYKETQGAVSRR